MLCYFIVFVNIAVTKYNLQIQHKPRHKVINAHACSSMVHILNPELGKFHSKLLKCVDQYENVDIDIGVSKVNSLKRKPTLPPEQKKHIIDTKGHEPYSNWDVDAEAAFLKLSTTGVVELFNMINKCRRKKKSIDKPNEKSTNKPEKGRIKFDTKKKPMVGKNKKIENETHNKFKKKVDAD